MRFNGFLPRQWQGVLNKKAAVRPQCHCSREELLFVGVDDSLVDSVPAGGGDTPVVGGVLVAVDADLSSLHFFVSIDTHGVYFFIVYIFDCQCVIAILPIANARQRYEHFFNWQKKCYAPILIILNS